MEVTAVREVDSRLSKIAFSAWFFAFLPTAWT